MTNYLWDNIFRKGHQKKELIQCLRENYLFGELSNKELRFIEKIVHERDYHQGEVVFRQGEAGVGMYIISRGSVDVYASEPISSESEESSEAHITQLISGDFFGEISLVEENSKRTATAIANTETRLIGFFKPDLMELLDRNPHIGVKVIFRLSEILGKRLAETTSKISLVRKELLRLQNRKRQRSL